MCPKCYSNYIFIPDNKSKKCICTECNSEFKREDILRKNEYIPYKKLKSK